MLCFSVEYVTSNKKIYHYMHTCKAGEYDIIVMLTVTLTSSQMITQTNIALIGTAPDII